MEYKCDYYQKAKSLALLEMIENGETSYHIVNFDKIISKHSVMKLDIPVVATFADGFVRKGVIKSISAKLTRMLSLKVDLENELKIKMFKPEEIDDAINNNVDPINRLNLLDARIRVNFQNAHMMNRTNHRYHPYNPLGLSTSGLMKINTSFNLDKY